VPHASIKDPKQPFSRAGSWFDETGFENSSEKKKMLAAVPFINHNPVRRGIWVVARTESKISKLTKLPLRFALHFDVPALHVQA
jgi:hypothetical protein